jgi:hypothetical protein
MSAKRAQRKAVPRAAMPVPRVRALRCDEIAEPEAVETAQMPRPRRHRKPKFVF